MPNIDLGAMTIPAFATIFGAGWGACHLYIVAPLRSRVEKLETKLDEIESREREELKELRALLRVSGKQ